MTNRGPANYLIIILGCMMSLCSCYPDRLFQTEGYPVSQIPDTSASKKEYVIQAEDVLTVNIFSKNGYALIDVLGNEQSAFASLSYRVNPNGYARLPMLDSVKLEG